MVEALPELVWLAVLLFAFAFVWTARKLLAAMFGALINAINAVPIPYLGDYIKSGLHAMEQACDNALGAVVSGIDSLIGASWHAFARLNEWLWRELRTYTLIGWLTAEAITDLTHAYHWLRNSVKDLSGLHHWVNARVRSLEREFHGIEHKVKDLQRDLSKGIGHDLRIGLNAAEKEIYQLEHEVIPAIRATEADAQSAIDNLYDWAKGKASLLGVGTFAAAVAAVIGVDAIRAFRCKEFLNGFKNRGCGLWSGLEHLLGLFVDVFLVTNLCEVIPVLEEAYSEVAAPAIGAITAAIDTSPCVHGHQAPALAIPALHLPTNPGIVLSLP